MEYILESWNLLMAYDIWNRRYTGSKYKLTPWISSLIKEHCKGISFCDIFAGTGVVAACEYDNFDKIIINDFLYSNNVIYNAFFLQENYDIDKLQSLVDKWQSKSNSEISENFVSKNYGGKYFSYDDAKMIGHLRECIESHRQELSYKEYNVLLASLLYSADKISNTVGHYDAFIKGKEIPNRFEFNFVKPLPNKNKNIEIYREDANVLAKRINCDVVYIDPPYNSRQYSRFYHVLETITKWDYPELFGEALKPEAENMSDYCRSSAKNVFADLICSLNCKYIVVSYNNTYNSKSSSSRNKIELDDIVNILSDKGELLQFEKKHQFFNTGKTEFSDHKELLFIVKVR